MQPQDILEQNPKLAHRMDRATAIMKYSVISMVLVSFVLMIFIVVQLLSIQAQITASLAENKAAGAANHAKTQQYVKCIADTLLEPIEQRKPPDFDKCGPQSTSQRKNSSAASTSDRVTAANTPNSTSTVSEQSNPQTTARTQTPTTSAPPADMPPATEDDGLVTTLVSPLTTGVKYILQGGQ